MVTTKDEPKRLSYQDIQEQITRLKYTPFASKPDRRSSLCDYGCHVFVGREVFDDGHETMVTLDALGAIAYDELSNALDDICSAVSKGRKVLLAQSPGRWVCPPSRISLEPRTYMPFNESQMNELRKMFESIPDMKLYENPFDNQPLLS